MSGAAEQRHVPEHWHTRLGVILAVAGSAVGLGNFLRFPGQAVANGGGAFMIPYICALLLLGIPLSFIEWTMGRYGGARGVHSAPAILGMIGGGRVARYLGVLGLLVPIVIYMYYGLIESWCLRYAVAYATGGLDLGDDPAQWVDGSKAYFASISGVGQDGVMLKGRIDPSVLFWAFVFVVNLWFIRRGLSRGIELLCRWAMPVMAVCAVFVLFRVLTLGTPDPSKPELNVLNGLGFMWNPDFSKLGSFDTWLAAAGQVFFSLSVGFGVILNYASYLHRKDDVVLSSLSAAATNEVFEVSFGGLITVTAAFVFLGASGAVGGTFGLGFNTLPVVFASLGAFGNFIGFVWFFMLFLAALTSSLSMLQPVAAFIEEALDVSRQRAVVWVAAIAGLGSFWVIYFSKDLVALDTMDFWVGTLSVFVLAMVQVICFAWFFGARRGWEEVNRGAQLRVPRFFVHFVRFVAPTYLLVIFIGFCIQNLPGYVTQALKNPVSAATLGLVAVVLLLFFVLTFRASQKHRFDAREDAADPDTLEEATS